MHFPTRNFNLVQSSARRLMLTGKSPSLPVNKASNVIKAKKALSTKKLLNHLLNCPTELLLIILGFLPTKDLATLRGANHSLQLLTHSVLASRLNKSVNGMTSDLSILEKAYSELYTTKKPQLRHFRGFLRNLPSSHLTEVTWYTSPPAELITVCECLCILKNGHSSIDASKPKTELWADLKKNMSRFDFKTWFLNLPKTVEQIDIQDVIRVQSIIMQDATITYERLREVSMAGYHLLIIVAACLQFGTLAQDLKIKKMEMKQVQFKLSKERHFLAAVVRSN